MRKLFRNTRKEENSRAEHRRLVPKTPNYPPMPTTTKRMTRKQAVQKVKEFAIHHAVGDLPYSALTLKALHIVTELAESTLNHGDLIDRNEVLHAYDREHKGPPGRARKIIEDATAIINADSSDGHVDDAQKEIKHQFAYTVHAELNNDGSYDVTMFDVGCDEAPIETVVKRAKITIEVLDDDCKESDRPLLFVEKTIHMNYPQVQGITPTVVRESEDNK